MKKYILDNLQAILIGVVIGLIIFYCIETLKDIILSIAIIQNK